MNLNIKTLCIDYSSDSFFGVGELKPNTVFLFYFNKHSNLGQMENIT